jgi:hypothetical protein
MWYTKRACKQVCAPLHLGVSPTSKTLRDPRCVRLEDLAEKRREGVALRAYPWVISCRPSAKRISHPAVVVGSDSLKRSSSQVHTYAVQAGLPPPVTNIQTRKTDTACYFQQAVHPARTCQLPNVASSMVVQGGLAGACHGHWSAGRVSNPRNVLLALVAVEGGAWAIELTADGGGAVCGSGGGEGQGRSGDAEVPPVSILDVSSTALTEGGSSWGVLVGAGRLFAPLTSPAWPCASAWSLCTSPESMRYSTSPPTSIPMMNKTTAPAQKPTTPTRPQ